MGEIAGDIRSGVSIIIPAFNDQAGLDRVLPELFTELSTLGTLPEVIVIDDGSTPALALSAKDIGRVRLIRHPTNRGYGASIKTGIRASKNKFVLLMDADGQHDPKYIPAFLEKIDRFDLVVGIRPDFKTSPLWRRPGKWILTRLFNTLSPTKLQDINCGFRCFRHDAILPMLPLCSNRFSFSISSTMLLLSVGGAVEFIPVHTRPRLGKSVMSWTTGLDTVLLIIRMIVLMEPLRFFMPISLSLFGLGFLWAIPYALKGRGLSVGALFLMLSGLLVFLLGVLSEQITALWKSRHSQSSRL